MKIKVIGIGACGNKASISALEQGVLDKEKILLINSTLKDIPEQYRDFAFELQGSEGGCGKERKRSAQLFYNNIVNGDLGQTLDNFITDEDEVVVIVVSTEGGTGSGGANIVAKYLDEEIGIPVHIFGITGFDEDGRGMENTIEFFQDLSKDYTIETLSNSAYLSSCSNMLEAEKACNNDFVKKLSILLEKDIIDATQNADERDVFKVITTPGYMVCDYVKLGSIKNVEQSDKAIAAVIDSNKSLEPEGKAAKRLVVFINAKEETLDNLDLSFNVIKSKFGNPYELFKHIQYNEEAEEFLAFVVAGTKMPLQALKDVYEKYKAESQKVVKEEDSFFDFVSDLRGNQEDSMFDSQSKRRKKKSTGFFANTTGLETKDITAPIDSKFTKVEINDDEYFKKK